MVYNITNVSDARNGGRNKRAVRVMLGRRVLTHGQSMTITSEAFESIRESLQRHVDAGTIKIRLMGNGTQRVLTSADLKPSMVEVEPPPVIETVDLSSVVVEPPSVEDEATATEHAAEASDDAAIEAIADVTDDEPTAERVDEVVEEKPVESVAVTKRGRKPKAGA